MGVLITGGAGYIGSHTILELLVDDFDIVIIDNLSNSTIECITRIEAISGKKIKFYNIDIRDKTALKELFSKHKISCVMHFAGLKSVNESVKEPISYYDNNIVGSLNLISVMKDFNVTDLIFSSSATVYGAPEYLPLNECAKTGGTTNPYGTSKLFFEKILRDMSIVDNTWKIVALRYFNPVGAHPSGMIGEDSKGIPNNLVPYLTRVAMGKLEKLSIYGNDYPTTDGTGVRDFIHVQDLATGHIAALKKIRELSGFNVFNLGTGNAYSVLELISTFEKITNKKVPYEIVDRRPGDIAECWSSPSLANSQLGWKAIYTLEDMLRDSWNWQIKNPEGYNTL